jgi:hypothetical protein
MTTRTRRVLIALLGFVAFAMLAHKVIEMRAERHLKSVVAELTRKYGSLFPGILNLPPVPADENRAAFLRAATDLVVFGSDDGNWIPRAYVEPRLATLASHRTELRALLARNGAPLELARKAKGLSKSNWGIQYASGIHTVSPPYERMFRIASLLHAGALLNLAEDHPDAALDWIETSLALAGSLRGEGHSSLLFFTETFQTAPISAVREVLMKSEPGAAALASLQHAHLLPGAGEAGREDRAAVPRPDHDHRVVGSDVLQIRRQTRHGGPPVAPGADRTSSSVSRRG